MQPEHNILILMDFALKNSKMIDPRTQKAMHTEHLMLTRCSIAFEGEFSNAMNRGNTTDTMENNAVCTGNFFQKISQSQTNRQVEQRPWSDGEEDNKVKLELEWTRKKQSITPLIAWCQFSLQIKKQPQEQEQQQEGCSYDLKNDKGKR